MDKVEPVASWSCVAKNCVSFLVFEYEGGVLFFRLVDVLINRHQVNWEDQFRSVAIVV